MQKNRLSTSSNGGEKLVQLEKWLPYRFFIIAARVAELLADYYGPRYGLTQAAWRILAVVGDKPGMSARQIRHAAGLDQFATSRAIGEPRQGFLSQPGEERRLPKQLGGINVHDSPNLGPPRPRCANARSRKRRAPDQLDVF